MKLKKSVSMLCVASLAMVALSACQTGNSGGPSASPGSGSSSLPMKDGKYDPPVTFTSVKMLTPAIKYRSGETPEDNVVSKLIQDKLGINVKLLWTADAANQAYTTKLKLMLSANQEMPDVIPIRGGGTSELVSDFINSGKIREVGSLFDKYASPTWKAAMNEDPSVWYPYMKDGKRYGLPVLDYTGNQDPVLWIRQDWLDKLHLQAPKTLADLEKVMDAFVNQDPDGDNKKDTYGLVYSAKDGFNSQNQGDTSWIFGMFGGIPKQWNLVDGKLQYGSINPNIKQGLATIQSWLAKGYVPQEAGLYTNTQAQQEFVSGKAGIIAGPLWFINPSAMSKVPGAVVKPYPIPTGPDGKAGRTSTRGSNGVILLSSSMQHPEEFFTYWNFFFDNYADPKPGSEFQYGLAKGYDWDVVNGQPTMDRAQVKDWISVDKYTLTYEGARIPSLQYKVFQKLASGQAPTTPAEKKFAVSFPKEWIDAGNIVEQQAKISMPDMYQGPATPTMQTKQDFLNTMELQTFSDIVYGKQPLSAFDDFVTKWKSSGGDQITKEVNDWYQSVTKK